MPRETDGKSCAFSSTSAFRVHHPPMTLYQVPDNGQTKSKTAMRPCRRDVGLPEALEDIRQEVLTDPLAGIGHDNLNARINPSRADLYAAALWSELDRIGGVALSRDPNGLLPVQSAETDGSLSVTRSCLSPTNIRRSGANIRQQVPWLAKR